MVDEIDDLLIYSSEKLNNLLSNSTNKNESIIKHVTSAKYPPISDFNRGKVHFQYVIKFNKIISFTDLEWFNVSEPLSFSKHLHGKLVLLDFFTYCCINCMHILPDLKEIENEFSIEDGLVVVSFCFNQ